MKASRGWQAQKVAKNDSEHTKQIWLFCCQLPSSGKASKDSKHTKLVWLFWCQLPCCGDTTKPLPEGLLALGATTGAAAIAGPFGTDCLRLSPARTSLTSFWPRTVVNHRVRWGREERREESMQCSNTKYKLWGKKVHECDSVMLLLTDGYCTFSFFLSQDLRL